MAENDAGTVRPFAAWLQEYADGDTHDELSTQLVKLVGAVQMCGKKGTLVYKITVSPAGRNSTNVMITDDVTLKTPEPARSETVWFVDDAGNPVRHNPAQMTLTLREVPRPQMAHVDPETGEIAQ